MLGSATGSNPGWRLGTQKCGYCLLSMSLVGEVRGVEAHCYVIVCLTLMTTGPGPPSGVHCKSPKGRRCTSFPCVAMALTRWRVLCTCVLRELEDQDARQR